MSTFKFAVKNRKQLAGAISEILNHPLHYAGMPTANYEIGDYTVTKDGTLIGDYNLNLFTGLAERGFEPEVSPVPLGEPQTEESPESEPKAAQAADRGEPDRLMIEFPLDGFSPDAVENLRRMVAAKEPLIKLALGAEKLLVVVTESAVQFPWFRLKDSENAAYYTQFISALCKTAKEKKRVTAKAPEHFENERFTMRVWLIGLGLVGDEYKLIRKLLCQPLSGNAAWRYGAPEKNAAPAAEEADTASE